MLAKLAEVRRRARQGGGRRRPEVHRAPPRPGQAAGPRADRAAARSRTRRSWSCPRWPAWGSDFAVGASVVTGIGVVSGVECLIVANDPTVKGGSSNPWTTRKVFRANDIALAEPAAGDLAGRVRRGGPAHPEGDLHPGRPAVPGPDPAVGGRHPDHRAGVRQLHRRRRLRAGHVRPRGDDRRAVQGVPGRAAAGEDGHRRGRRRRVARRRRGCTPRRPGWPTTWPPTSRTRSGSAAGSWPG